MFLEAILFWTQTRVFNLFLIYYLWLLDKNSLCITWEQLGHFISFRSNQPLLAALLEASEVPTRRKGLKIEIKQKMSKKRQQSTFKLPESCWYNFQTSVRALNELFLG